MDLTDLKKLTREWRKEALMHRRCQEEREDENGVDEHDEEWLMHHEAATVYDRCADELERVYRLLAAASTALTT